MKIPWIAMTAALATALTLPAGANQVPARPTLELSLADAVEMAAERNLGIRLQATSLDVAREARRAVWAQYHPTFAMDLSYSPAMDHALQRVAGNQLESLYRNYNLTANSSLTNRFVTGTEVSVTWFHLSSRSERIKDEFQELLETISGISDPITTSFTASGAIQVRQNLLKGLGPWYNLGPIRQSKLSENSEEIAYDAQVSDVLGSVVKAYFELAYAQRAVEIAELSLELAAGQREVTQARIQAGDLAPIELMKLDETVATRQQELLEANMSVRRTEITLRSLLSSEPRGELSSVRLRAADSPDSAPIPRRELDPSLETALLRNPELRRQELDLQGREIGFRMARQDLLPTLDLTGSLALNGVGETSPEGLEDAFSGNHPYWTFGVQLTIPLTNRAAETDYRSRKIEVEASLLTLKSLQESTLAEVETTHTQILSYEEQIRVARTRVMLAEHNVEAEQARYAAGKSTTREVLEVQKSLRDAQLAEIRAQINGLAARVDLELQRGSLLETFGIREIAL
jgi:outer membrane protein